MIKKGNDKLSKKESKKKLDRIYTSTISKLDHLPYYLQLKNILINEIRSGVLKETIPSERELAEKYHLNRVTVRHTLDELAKEGLILKRKGQPTVIIPSLHMERDYANELISFSEEMERKGLLPSSKVLLFEKRHADKNISEKLNIPKGEEIVVLERVRYGNGESFNLGISYLPLSFCPSIFDYDFNRESLHHVLRSAFGINLVMSYESFEPALPTEREARLLEIPVCSAILSMEGITYSSDGRIVEYFVLKFRGDKAKITVKVFKKP